MSRNKEKVSGIFRRLFRSATREGEGPSKAGANGGAGSPARHRYLAADPETTGRKSFRPSDNAKMAYWALFLPLRKRSLFQIAPEQNLH
nr:unnamed protein product [Callosobruchus chinensis]